MTSESDRPVHVAQTPRWLHAVSLTFMGVLTTLVVLLVLGFLVSGPEENLAGVLLVIAALLAVPLLVALASWVAGVALRRRAPGVARILVVVSVVAGGLGMLLVMVWFLPEVLP